MANQITFVDISRAAEQLVAEGRPVGPTKVREMLGRGSFTTVQKYLAEWEGVQAQVEAKAQEEKRIGPPDELAGELQKIMAAYWPHAVNRAREQMQPEIESLRAQLLEATSRNKEALVEMANLENKLEAASAKALKMEEAEKRAGEANLKIIAMQADLSRLEKIESRFDGQKELIQTLQPQVKALGEQNVSLTKKADGLSAELVQARNKLEVALVKAARLEETEKRLSVASEKLSAAQSELSRLEKVEARTEAEIKGLREHNAQLTKSVQTLGAELKDAGIKLAKLETKSEMLMNRK